MEKITELLNNIKDRFSNPLIFSFVSSWLIINWKISIGLIWYDTEQIKNYGYNTIFDFITVNLNFKNAFLLPFLFALFYTFIFPVIKNLISAFYSWNSKWGDNWNLKILNEGKVSIEKYLGLKAKYEERTKNLEKVIESESQYMVENMKINNELTLAKDKINENSKELFRFNTIINNFQDNKIINGTWEVYYEYKNGENKTEKCFINNGKYYEILSFNNQELKYNINEFYYNEIHKSIFFIKETLPEFNTNEKNIYINKLNIISNDLIIGTEDNQIKIEYRRK